MRDIKKICGTIAVALLGVIGTSGVSRAVSPAGDVVGAVTVGYQGWFSCDGDSSGLNQWWHFSADGLQPNNNDSVIHAWPDMREFTNQYVTAYPNLGDGQTSELFSSYDQQVVNTHFSWMAANGINTAALQRFGADLQGGTLTFRNGVTSMVMSAAQTYGVKFYIMYDSSGWTNFTNIESDWTNEMVNTLHVTSSADYAKQNGKPVVCIWGPGFNDGNHPGTAAQWLSIIQWFQSQGCYVIGGTPTNWLAGDSDSQSGFLGTYSAYNAISPWMVGRIGTISDDDSFRTNVTNGDISYCNAHGIDYQPCVLPGDTGQRLHGTFMWEQFGNEIQAGAAGIYISMFDEFNEGNQIAKTAEDSAMSPAGGTWQQNNNGTITNVPFFTLDQDGVHCSSDFYLRETNYGGQMLRGQIPFTWTNPAPVVLAPSAPTNLTTTAGTGQATLQWTASDETSSYNVYRSTSSGGEGGTPVVTGIAATTSGIVPRPTITYTNTGLSAGTTYYYKVAAVNPTGTSATSNEASASLGGGTEGPYGGTPAAVPGTVQAENYDTGGQGVGYSVSSVNGTGNSYRSDGVDLESCSDTGGGYDLGWTAAGQWTRYTVNVATAGTYTIACRVASGATSAGTFHIQNSSGTNLSGTITAPVTGGWQTWTTVNATVTLPTGKQTLTVSQDSGGYNINYLAFTTNAPTCATKPSAPSSLTASGTTSTSTNLSWGAVTPPANCTISGYEVYKNGTALAAAGGTTYTATGLSPSTAYTFTVAAIDSAGTGTVSGGVNVTTSASGGEAPYGGTAAAIPGTVQAENYDTGGQGVAYNVTASNGTTSGYRTDGIDIETTSDTGGGYDVGWTAGGQWFRYTVNVATAGSYTVSFRVAAPSAVSDGLHLSNSSGTNLSGSVNIPASGGWQTWETVNVTVTLPAGQQVLTLNEDNGGWNINYMTFASSGGTSGSLSGSVTAITGTDDINLTTLGTSDWAAWGYNTSSYFDHDASGGSQISTASAYGGGTLAPYNNAGYSFFPVTWTNGTPDTSATNEQWLYVNGGGVGDGFQFTAPATTTSHKLMVYVGGWESGGTLTATLSDGSAATYTDSSQANTGASYYAVYTLTYNAASAGQKLTVVWKQASGTGNLDLVGAALQ